MPVLSPFREISPQRTKAGPGKLVEKNLQRTTGADVISLDDITQRGRHFRSPRIMSDAVSRDRMSRACAPSTITSAGRPRVL